MEAIKRDHIYEHEDYGEVLVVSLIETYSEMTPDGSDQQPDGRAVRFFTNFESQDEMNEIPLSESIEHFCEVSSEKRKMNQ